ncbi:uncharacterized protein PAC_17822 [Phialocephala subalpina]|uniref:CorA-like transporter domain-containing protein n=1 Tax=Phialocephala subalpina TaxID=576137 RepID=A0A1L7XSA1_9HELO|nr:uncharacterized protein PAC_17822 [Phialocephala subalpina]
MAPTYHLDDLRSLEKKINEKAHDLFKEKPGRAGLQVTRIFKQKTGNRDIRESERTVFIKDLDVCDVSAVKALQHDNQDDTQIYTIRQDRSWTTLNISRDLFEGFVNTHNVMPPFWKHMFTFGRKIQENEFQFPHFARRSTSSWQWLKEGSNEQRGEAGHQTEYAYMLRRVEINGRARSEDDNPWSIRQTAVYSKFSNSARPFIAKDDQAQALQPRVYEQAKCTFLLVAPSENAEAQFAQCLSQSTGCNGTPLTPWNIHRILVADSLSGWMDYMAYLEKRLKEQSDHVVLATVGDDKVNLSPLTDFIINFDDRQQLKIIEDQVLDLQVILPGILDAVTQLQKEFSGFASHSLCFEEKEREELYEIAQEFKEYVREAGMLIDRSKALNDMAISTARLLSDLLSYEEAVSLKKLSYETQMESKSMGHLAEKSTKDAAAVKILTVITLIYLPFAIVSSFFSTQFVTIKEDGHLHLATNVWLLAVIAIPLTAITIGSWWTWVYLTEVKPTQDPLQPGIVTLQRQHSFKSIMSSKKKHKPNDLESGLGLARSPMFPPAFHAGSPTSTWSSQATTVKSEKSG